MQEEEDIFCNENSLRVTHEISLLKLRDLEHQTFQFYLFLGLLPGGAYPSQLE